MYKRVAVYGPVWYEPQCLAYWRQSIPRQPRRGSQRGAKIWQARGQLNLTCDEKRPGAGKPTWSGWKPRYRRGCGRRARSKGNRGRWVQNQEGETMSQSLRYQINVPHIVHEIFDDQEAAIINLKSGTYYSLDPVGTYIWAQLAPSATIGEMVEAVVSRYEGGLGEIVNA